MEINLWQEMTKEEITKVMCLGKVSISLEEIDRVWEAAQSLDPEGKCRVCYQTFREALCMVSKRSGVMHFLKPAFLTLFVCYIYVGSGRNGKDSKRAY